jgi:hypothetical protein
MTPKKSPTPAPSRLDLLAQLDFCLLSGRRHSLGPGGASSIFSRAVDKALCDEIADQLRGGSSGRDSEIGKWAAEIIEAFREPVN